MQQDPSRKRPRATLFVVMGVCGAGKSTTADLVGARLQCEVADGDAFHSAANKAKMAGGTPLNDDDRWPWLESIGNFLAAASARGGGAVVSCSALKRKYRDKLRASAGGAPVLFAHLTADPAVITARIEERSAKTGHYMKAGMLASQLAALEPLEPDELACGVVVDVTSRGPEDAAAELLAAAEAPSPSPLASRYSFEPMEEAQMPELGALQASVYPPPYHEHTKDIWQRARLFPQGSFVVRRRGAAAGGERDGALIGYCAAYPWPRAAAHESPPMIGDAKGEAMILEGLRSPADAVLWVHEITLHAQGEGIGTAALEALLATARALGFREAMLVAVLGRAPFWASRGFSVFRELPSGYYLHEETEEEKAEAAAAAAAMAPFSFEKRAGFFSSDWSATVMQRIL